MSNINFELAKSKFSVFDLLNLSIFLKYWSSFLTNTWMYLCTCVNMKIYIRTKKKEYTSTNYYLHYICTNTGSKLIEQIQQILDLISKWKNSSEVLTIVTNYYLIYSPFR